MTAVEHALEAVEDDGGAGGWRSACTCGWRSARHERGWEAGVEWRSHWSTETGA